MMGVIILWEVLENRDLCIIIAAVDRFYGDEKLRRERECHSVQLI
ncbi:MULTISPECIES: hypothetical protein [Paenibacillus]|nr:MULTISPECIES: hypothetical protein [Paenibacillus]